MTEKCGNGTDYIRKIFEYAKKHVTEETINEILNIVEKNTSKNMIFMHNMRKFGNSEFFTKPTNYYNLEMIIAIGYRVKSVRGTQFRIWANKLIKK